MKVSLFAFLNGSGFDGLCYDKLSDLTFLNAKIVFIIWNYLLLNAVSFHVLLLLFMTSNVSIVLFHYFD